MIPILYSQEETTFASNGIGRLVDCISCEVTEERNGEFEVEFQYPITGKHYGEIKEGRIILVDHDEQKDAQPFVIYRHSAPINGVVTFNAHHISYKLSSVIMEPFTASSVADAFNTFTADSMNPNPFTFWTDNSTGGTMKSEVPASVRSLMGGTEGSILDVFGGEYAFDKFLVKNYANRGSDKGVTIRYGKNLTNIVWEVDTMDLYSNVVPFWSDGESTVVYGGIVGANLTAYWTDENGNTITDENNVPIELARINNNVTTLDLSSEFEEAPTVADLEARAAQFLASNQPWIPKENIKIEFVPLWQTDEYADVAPLERVCLCDTVTVYYTNLGVRATAKVIKVVWDALLEKYKTIELGQAKSSFADTIIGAVDNKLAEAIANVPTTSAMQAAIDNATSLITGGMGGHIVFLYDADGKPTDMLVMDTDDVNTAVHVLRINVNGIGFSSTGVSGTYSSAWTLDGAFVADWITAGHLSANRIQGGTLTLGGNNNGNGVIVVYDADGNEVGRWDKDGISAIGTFESIYKWNYDPGPGGGGVRAVTTETLFDSGCVYFYGDTGDTYARGAIGLSYILQPRYGGFTDPTTAPLNITVDYNSAIKFVRKTSASGNQYNSITVFDATHQPQINSTSSKRFKHDITDKIDDELDAHRLYKLVMKQFVYNDDHEPQYQDMTGETLPGFIAEDVAEIYPSAVIHDWKGDIESWDERRIIPGMLKLIQEQHEEIEDLKERLAKLEQVVDMLMKR